MRGGSEEEERGGMDERQTMAAIGVGLPRENTGKERGKRRKGGKKTERKESESVAQPTADLRKSGHKAKHLLKTGT